MRRIPVGLGLAAAIAAGCSVLFPIDDGFSAGGVASMTDGPTGDAPDEPFSSPPELFAGGESHPHGIVLDATAVYWQTDGQISGDSGLVDGEVVRQDRTPGAVRRRVAGSIPDGSALTADTTTLFWLEDDNGEHGRVARIEKDGTRAQVVVPNLFPHHALGLDTSFLHFVEQFGRLSRATKDGTVLAQATTQYPPSSGFGLAIAADWIYLAVGAQIFRVAKDDPNMSSSFAASASPVTALVTNTASVYWVAEAAGRVYRLDRDHPNETPVELAAEQKRPSAIAITGTSVYWTNRGDGSVMRVAMAGGAPTVIARDQKDPVGIAADEDAVFWTTAGDGTVMMARILRR